MNLTILNANFHSYQLNNCNCLSDITKLFCCHFNTNERKSKIFIFLPNWLKFTNLAVLILKLTSIFIEQTIKVV